MTEEIARIEHQPDLVVAGLRKTIKPPEGYAELWKEVVNSITLAGADVSQAQQIAIMFGANANQEFDYMAGVVIDSRESAAKLGLNAAEVPAGEYAIVDVQGPALLASATGMDYLIGDFIPNRGLVPTGPAMEIFGPGDTTAEDYMMQVWVPIKAAEHR
ncbi:GyrI-like domain-containing protein [Rothia sp. LK2588]|uniref:GyrI-like domain-containing protein n=1 Tax=Rothia sp. LK2588 TaxID=3114369 RepID=UPI0034CDAB43